MKVMKTAKLGTRDIKMDNVFEEITTIDGFLQQQYPKFAKKSKTVFFVLDRDERIRFVSDYIRDLFSYEPNDLIGKVFSTLLDSTNSAQFSELIRTLQADRREPLVCKDLGLFCREGYRHYFDGLIMYYEVLSDSPYVVYLHDVTDRRLREDALKRWNEALDSFVYKASHDLKAPLSSLEGLINLTASSSGDDARTYIELMRKSVKKLDQYISQLTERTRNATEGLRQTRIDVSILIRETVDLVRFMPQAKGVRFELDIPDVCFLNVDALHLQLILNNLISNAIKYRSLERPVSFVRVMFRTVGPWLELQVADNGIGIEESHLPYIFDEYHRATSHAEGSGLGLNLVQRTIEKLKGSVHVSSRVGKGSAFIVKLPVSPNPSETVGEFLSDRQKTLIPVEPCG